VGSAVPCFSALKDALVGENSAVAQDISEENQRETSVAKLIQENILSHQSLRIVKLRTRTTRVTMGISELEH
jgi:hypothetical protein